MRMIHRQPQPPQPLFPQHIKPSPHIYLSLRDLSRPAALYALSYAPPLPVVPQKGEGDPVFSEIRLEL